MERAAESTKQVGRPQTRGAPAARSMAEQPPLHPMLQLQRDIGNQAVLSLLRSGAIRAKLAVGSPDDPEEKEADEVVDKVMRKPSGAAAAGDCTCAAGGEMCEECQKKELDQTGGHLWSGAAPGRPPHIPMPPRSSTRPSQRPAGPLDSSTRTDMEFASARISATCESIPITARRNWPAPSTRSPTRWAAISCSAKDNMRRASDAGRSLLAHELAHVAQAQRMRAPSVIRRKKDPPFVIVPVAGTADPLAAYVAMRERLSPSDWNALNAAARRRADTIISGQQPVQENELVKTEISVPVQDLFQPLVNQSRASGGDQWLRDVYALADAGGGATAMGQRIQDEILYGWIAANEGVMDEPVTIALVDPEGKAGGFGSLLTISLRGRPVASANGLLTLPNVDKAIGGSVEDFVARMNGELNILVAAIQKVDTARAMLAAARDIAGQGHDKVAAQSLDQIDAAMRKAAADLGSVTGNPFAELVQPGIAELTGFLGGQFAAYRKADTEWRVAHPRQKSDYERQTEALEKQTKEEEENPSIFGKMYIVDTAKMLGTQDLAMGGAPDQQRALGQAYDQGLISYASWSEGVAKAERRGEIFGGVTLALTIATAGLGIFVAPATLGGAVLLGAGTGLVLATGPMLASNLYTSNVDFDDPALQQWWKAGAYSGRDIAVAGLVGAGIGAALPIAGKLLGGLRARASRPWRPWKPAPPCRRASSHARWAKAWSSLLSRPRG